MESVTVRCHFLHEKPSQSSTSSPVKMCLSKGKLRFSHEDSKDIQLADVIAAAYNDENSNTDCRLQLIRYVVDGVKRRRNDVVLEFEDAETAEKWNNRLSKELQQKMPPHKPSQKRDRRKVLVLVNPFSGQKKAEIIWETQVRPILELAAIDYEVVHTEGTGHAITVALELDLDHFDAVLIDSGDGLVSEFITGLLKRKDRERALKLPIAHIPGGTSNALASSICYAVNEPFPPWADFAVQMALMVAKPRYLPLQLFEVETDRNGRIPMFMTAVWGLIADIDIGSERFRWAGMIRLHLEAIIRIAQLPTVARYHGRISYIPAGKTPEDQKRLLRATMVKAAANRKLFGEGHFLYPEVEDWQGERDASNSAVTTMPTLSEPLDSSWTVIEGDFVSVSVSAISHLGSDLPLVASAKLSDEVLYLTLIDWATVKTRGHVAHQLITICDSQHLGHPSMQMIPVRAVRIEPLDDLRGHFAVDGEPYTRGSTFQVYPTGLSTTVVAREEVCR